MIHNMQGINRVDSHLKSVSIKFDEEESTDAERNTYFIPGRFDCVKLGHKRELFIAEVDVPMVVEGIQVCQITERFCL